MSKLNYLPGRGAGLFIALLLLFSGADAGAQDVLIVRQSANPNLLKDANQIVRTYEHEYRLNKLGSATERVHKVVTLLNSKAQQEAKAYVLYDGNIKINDFQMVGYDAANNEFARLKRRDMKDEQYISSGQFYEDNRVLHGEIACTSFPCTIETTYERTLTGVAALYYPSFEPQDVYSAVEKASFTVAFPASNAINYRGHSVPEPKTTTADGITTYSWEVSGLAALQAESYAPATPLNMPYLRFSLRDLEADGYRGSFADWNSYGKFMYQLWEGRQALPEQLKSLVRERVAGATTGHEKIDRLYKLLQERTRYVGIQLGIGGWQPFTAEYVETNRYGDCKALSNYMGAMLQEVGIESTPVVVYWGENEYWPVGEDFTTSAFNHVILYVPSEDMYLECTSSDAPTGYLGEGKDDRNVVFLTPEGGKLVRTPALRPAENGYLRNVDLQLNESGSVELAIRTDYYGGAQETLRQLPRELPDREDQLKYLQRADYIPDVKGEYTFKVEPDEPIVHFGYTTTVPNYTRKMGSRRFLPLNRVAGFDLYIPEPDEDRRFDIDFDQTRFYVDSIRLHLPGELELEAIGERETVYEHAIGEYRSTVKETEDGLLWVRTLKLVPAQLPKEAFAEFRQFLVDVSKADRRQVVVRERRTK